VSLSLHIERALGDFALDVRFEADGGVTALFGPSGAGKTLTLRAIAGLITPDAGRIVVAGRTLFDSSAGIDLAPRERRIGYLFQQYALFPHLTLAENVGYGLHRLPKPARADRIVALLELVGLEGFERRRPHELSGGLQQRGALARALAPEPDLLLLDEPFAAIDLGTRRRLRAELRRIQQATATPMLLVTHDPAEVRQLADTLVVFENGRGRSGEVGSATWEE
jgi:molybdate transport system ATP-binding protein